MAPQFLVDVSGAFTHILRREEAFPGLRDQWTKPRDIFSILLILGGDIVQRALAQLVGSTIFFTPVAFSFGWVAYAVSSVVAVIGDGKLMPLPDYDSIVINAQSGYVRNNKSWILGRILRDWPYKEEWEDYALVVTVVKASRAEKAGVPKLDRPWIIGVCVIVTQIVLSAVPGILNNSWSCLTVTAGGTLLCLTHGALSQWKKEKWSCRDLAVESKRPWNKPEPKNKTVILTQGNGSPHAIVVISEGVGLDLEDLAGARMVSDLMTIPAVISLTVIWIALLLTASGVRDNPWFLLLVGGLGIGQNIYAAGCKRKPEAYGIHLDPVVDIVPDQKYGEDGQTRHPEFNKVFAVLKKLDEFNDPKLGFNRTGPDKTGLDGVGLALLPVFLPGDLRPNEQTWKDERIDIYKKNKAERKRLENKSNRTANAANTAVTLPAVNS